MDDIKPSSSDNLRPIDEVIAELAALDPIEYETQREAVAEQYSVRKSALDKAVADLRPALKSNGHDDLTDGVIPWSDPVDGLNTAAEVRALFNRYCILPDGADVALTLWSIATYSIDQFRVFPKAYLSSPEKRCGKTTTLETISAVVDRALMASNLTAAVMFRAIEAWRPTLLIDEADTFVYGDNDELRGIINSGHTRSGAYVLRVEEVGGERVPVKFSTWTPQCMAGIKSPPETIRDRSVLITLRRKLPGESVTKLPLDLQDDTRTTRQKIRRWSDDHALAIRNQSPDVPVISNERAMDNWLPLLAIADVLGDDWPILAREAMRNLETTDDVDDDGIGPMILSDIREIFMVSGLDRITSQTLVDKLVDMEDRPWPEWRRGSPLTKNSLARLLKPFRIKSTDIRTPTSRTALKGYKRENFEDAFSRYLSPIPSATTRQSSVTASFGNSEPQHETRRRTSSRGVADEVAEEFQLKHNGINVCRVAADGTGARCEEQMHNSLTTLIKQRKRSMHDSIDLMSEMKVL